MLKLQSTIYASYFGKSYVKIRLPQYAGIKIRLQFEQVLINGKSARKIMTENSKPTEHIAFRLSS